MTEKKRAYKRSGNTGLGVENRKRLLISISEEYYNKIFEIADKYEISGAEVIRQCISKILKIEQKKIDFKQFLE